MGEDWQVRRSLENSLPLDRCQWRFAGGKWSDWMPVWLAQKQLRAEMKAPHCVAYPAASEALMGELCVGGRRHRRDVCVLADGTVAKRRKRVAKSAYGTAHALGPEDLVLLCRGLRSWMA